MVRFLTSKVVLVGFVALISIACEHDSALVGPSSTGELSSTSTTSAPSPGAGSPTSPAPEPSPGPGPSPTPAPSPNPAPSPSPTVPPPNQVTVGGTVNTVNGVCPALVIGTNGSVVVTDNNTDFVGGAC